jgi:hypothetical protein
MNICIYCRSELPANVPREHVIPQSFGVFTPDLTLGCVCSACNRYFGSKLEWPMLNQSIEGALRLQFGLKGVVGGVGTKGVMPTVAEGDDWKGARTAIRTRNSPKSSKTRQQVLGRTLPQCARRSSAGPRIRANRCVIYALEIEADDLSRYVLVLYLERPAR